MYVDLNRQDYQYSQELVQDIKTFMTNIYNCKNLQNKISKTSNQKLDDVNNKRDEISNNISPLFHTQPNKKAKSYGCMLRFSNVHSFSEWTNSY